MGDRLRADWSGRLDRAWRAASAPGRAAFVVSTPPNLSYLCGFGGTQGLLVLSPGATWLLLDGRYAQAFRGAIAAGQAGPVDVRLVPGRFEVALASLLKELPDGEVAFEAEQVTVATLATWQSAAAPRALIATSGVIETLRSVKDADEVQAIRRACTRLSAVARSLKDWVASGRTERQVAADIDGAIFRSGFERLAFPTIVASGPNSAHPHARPGDRLLQNGDLVVLDFGGVLDGYCGDLTRMATVGQPRGETLALVNAVRAAQDAALGTVRAGALAFEVDGAARDVLTRLGLGEAFLHATGHGLGLEVHEAPRIGRADADRVVRLQAGMVCTIEPGAYVDGLGGARMEDDILVTADGCEVLTDAPRDLLVV